jgi:hypothetical protein
LQRRDDQPGSLGRERRTSLSMRRASDGGRERSPFTKQSVPAGTFVPGKWNGGEPGASPRRLRLTAYQSSWQAKPTVLAYSGVTLPFSSVRESAAAEGARPSVPPGGRAGGPKRLVVDRRDEQPFDGAPSPLLIRMPAKYGEPGRGLSSFAFLCIGRRRWARWGYPPPGTYLLRRRCVIGSSSGNPGMTTELTQRASVALAGADSSTLGLACRRIRQSLGWTWRPLAARARGRL